VQGFTHPDMGANDCSSCHFSTSEWTGSAAPNALVSDPVQNLAVSAGLSNCNNCHPDRAIGAGSTRARCTPRWRTWASRSPAPAATATRAACPRAWWAPPPHHLRAGAFVNGNRRALTNGFNHFFPADCKECHRTPTGTTGTNAGTTYTTMWKFNHSESKMTNPTTCHMCHGSPNNIPN
jgi:hypothetical protein